MGVNSQIRKDGKCKGREVLDLSIVPKFSSRFGDLGTNLKFN
jgi:hypothetical protein